MQQPANDRTLREALHINRGLWVGFEKYEIREGCIVPASAKAKILEGERIGNFRWRQYDPWTEYRNSKQQKRTQPPYQSLLALLERLQIPRMQPLQWFAFPGSRNEPAHPKEPFEGGVAAVDGSELAATPENTRRLIRKLFYDISYKSAISRVLRDKEAADAFIQSHPLHYDPVLWVDELTEHGVLPLGPEKEAAILEWCSKWGLLGILPHTTISVSLPPREVVAERNFRHVYQCQDTFIRVNGHWHANAAFEPERMRSAGTIRYRLETGGIPTIVQEPITDYWARFFPEARYAQAPQSDEFWMAYREPIADFLMYAALFREAVELVMRGAGDHEPLINHFLAVGGEWLRQDDKSTQLVWVYPSLLAAFAKMFIQDHLAGVSLRACGACRMPFLSTAYQSQYCSPRCQWRANKQKHRKRDLVKT